jgi:hypothetical protein
MIISVLLAIATALPAGAQSDPGAGPASAQPSLAQAAREAGANPASAQSLAQAVAAQLPMPRETRLVAPDGMQNDWFGYSVSLSGNRALIGAYQPLFTGPGYAYVFAFDGTNWTVESKLTAADGMTGDGFGRAVSLVGNRALVGAWNHNSGTGAAYVFDFDGANWTQTAELMASDGTFGATFGLGVSLDGDRALIGASRDAYIFDFNGSAWSQTAKLLTTDGNHLGPSVSLSGDRALVGGSTGHTGSPGLAYIFAFDGTAWSQEAELSAPDPNRYDHFGGAVSLYGTNALIGAGGQTVNGEMVGSAYIFSRAGTTWLEQAELMPTDGYPYSGFGNAVSLVGRRAVISAGAGGASGNPAAYLFVGNNTGWSERASLQASDGTPNDGYGISVSLSGQTVIVGAPQSFKDGDDSGAAYVFQFGR